MTIVIPADIDPLERHYRYSIHIDAELRLAGMGCSAGGGTLFSEGEDEEAETCLSLLDVDATDVDGARAVIRQHLPELGIPAGTLLQWDRFEDYFDGKNWQLNRPRSFDEFDL